MVQADVNQSMDGPDDGDMPTVGDLIHADAQLCVRNHVIAAMALGTVPVPVIDVAAVIGVSVRMVSGLSDVYGVEFSGEAARAALLSILPAVLPVSAAALGGSLLKSVPGLGALVAGAGVSLFSGAVVYAMGQVFVRHYEAGGTLADLDIAQARRRVRALMAQGRAYAQQVAAQARGKSDAADTAGTEAASKDAAAGNATATGRADIRTGSAGSATSSTAPTAAPTGARQET